MPLPVKAEEGLLKALSTINKELREHSVPAVTTSFTLRNWFFGFTYWNLNKTEIRPAHCSTADERKNFP